MADSRERRDAILPRWAWVSIALAIAAVAVGTAVLSTHGRGGAELANELEGRGRLFLLGGDELEGWIGAGSEAVTASSAPAVERALAGADPVALGRAIDEARVAGIVVDGTRTGSRREGAPLRERLLAYDHVPGLRGHYLAPSGALYLRDDRAELGPELSRATARIARELVGGREPPPVSMFPAELRRIGNVEVMVMLRHDGRPRLWRSARGSSIARALVTAAVVARQRWEERETSMGGPLDRVLPDMRVEVALLNEDGTLGARSAAFVERVFTPAHGVAYERKGVWRYALPDVTREAGSAVRAYARLFEEHGLPADSLDREDLRLYRLVAIPLGVSEPASAADGASPEDAGADGAGASASGGSAAAGVREGG